ncbi:hypothetical protein GHT06_013052 [Daphnia sinensis]|uniref:Uncharacterized protein n=1 Tax=Daphnia sinensis TaxID=1820382 RepID=A0AAD5KZF3_9CRUS|nr:hypothetical protein GHT06_013052 [Daphnia sinensis]
MEFATRVFLLCVYSVVILEAYGYQIYYLEDANVCSSAKRTIKMNSRSTALLIQLSKYPHVTELAIDCHLEIEAPKNQGLQVVVEDINLRRNPLDNECDDYVWFGRDDDGYLSKKLCGERKLVPIYDYTSERSSELHNEEVLHNYVESLIPEGPEATTFYDPGGELHIWFRKTSRKVDQNLQPLRLKVVVTSYRTTCKTNDTAYWPCIPSVDKSTKLQEKCIPSNLKCDGHVNCGAGLFSDETGCAVATSSNISNNAISTASLVILGAVALLILCLMASMVCFCRRRKARLRRARNQDDCQVVSTLPIPHHAGEVPLERWRVPHHDETQATKAVEDPPPSYSELFPDYAAVPQQSTDSN